MEKELTLSEMTHLHLAHTKPDPINYLKYPDSNSTFKKFETSQTVPLLRKTFLLPSAKLLPANHYIEHRFQPYLRAKNFKKNLFKGLISNTNCLTDRPSSSNRFKTSRYPQVPLSRELIEKVESVNTYRKCEKKQTGLLTRPCSQLSCSRKGLDNSRSDRVFIVVPNNRILRKRSIFE